MNIEDALLNYLKDHQKADIKGFGVFSLENVEAKIDDNQKVILPPAKQIIFTHDSSIKGKDFLYYLSQKNAVEQEQAEVFLNNQVEIWSNKVENQENFLLSNLGEFRLTEKGYHFVGNRIENSGPDYFGLEKINLNKVGNPSAINSSSLGLKEHPATKYVFWLFLIILPVVGLAYVVFQYGDLIKDQSKLDDVSIITSTHRIEEQNFEEQKPIIKDSIKVDTLDSIELDSTKNNGSK